MRARGGFMKRREALRIFAAGAVLPAFSPELFALFRQAQPPPGYAMRTLTGHLNDTVVAMIDQIIPATDTPGAKGARVNEFIDVILTEWALPEERQRFLEGLAGIDKQSQSLYGKNFSEATPDQQLARRRGRRRLHEQHHVRRTNQPAPPTPRGTTPTRHVAR